MFTVYLIIGHQNTCDSKKKNEKKINKKCQIQKQNNTIIQQQYNTTTQSTPKMY